MRRFDVAGEQVFEVSGLLSVYSLDSLNDGGMNMIGELRENNGDLPLELGYTVRRQHREGFIIQFGSISGEDAATNKHSTLDLNQCTGTHP
jgi:hypothetical protein